MTLTQYAAQARPFFPSNTTLMLLPGNHSLSSPLMITNILRLELVTNTILLQPTVRVLCSSSARFELATITEVFVSGLQFTGCTGNTLTSVEEFVLEDSTFQQGEYSYGTLLTLREMTDALIVASTFTGINWRQSLQAITVYSSHLRVINDFFNQIFAQYSSSIVYSFNTTLEIEGSTFADNYLQGGRIVDTDDSVVTIHSSTFSSNVARCCSSAVVINVEDGTLTVENSTFENNQGDSASNNGMQGITIVRSNVTLNSSIFSNSIFQSNGGIYASESVLVIEGCSFLNNTASNSYSGAVYAYYSTVTIKSAEFINNSAGSGVAVNTYDSYILIEDSMFIGNRAGSSGGVISARRKSVFITNSIFSDNIAGYSGGVIYTSDNVSITITSSTFNSNRANASDGGALYAYNSNMTISNSTLTNNTTFEDGGGLYADQSTMVNVTNTIFSNNTANSEDGGGVRIRNGIVVMINNTFSGNRAGDDGGAVDLENIIGGRRGGDVETRRYPSILENITFIDNVAIGNGGGVSSYESSMDIINCRFSSNMAGRHGGSLVLEDGTFSITNTSFNNNTAWRSGGAVEVWNSSITITNSSFNNNTAWRNGGAVDVWNSTITITNVTLNSNVATNGGGVDADESIVVIVSSYFSYNRAGSDGGALDVWNSTITITDANLISNSATGYGGGVGVSESTACIVNGYFSNNTASRDGGAVNIWNSSITTINVTLNRNIATNHGGGVAVSDSVILTTNSYFSNNTAGHEGGGVAVFESTSYLEDTIFDTNSAGRYGGAINTWRTFVTTDNSVFVNNTAGLSGGAFTNSRGTATVRSSTFTSNTGLTTGSSVSISDSTTNITNSTFTYNVAHTDGGVLYSWAGSTVVISDCEFSHNTAHRRGGVLYLSDSVINLKSSTFTHNAVLIQDSGDQDASGSTQNGGVMNVRDTNVTINHCTFVGNAAHGDGGVMETEDSTINISNSVFRNNTASHVGGVFKSRSSATVVDSGVLTDYESNQLTIFNSSFDSNVASNQGGIIGSYYSHLSMVTCSLNSNLASQGAAIHAEYSTVTVRNTTCSSNRAHVGGVMSLYKSTTTISDTNIINNTASNDAGAIHADNSTINLTNITFSLNDAFVGAGVIHGTSSTLNSWGLLVIRQNRGGISVVNIEMSRATFRGVLTFESNYGSLFILRSAVTFSGKSVFTNNTGNPLNSTSEFSEGGALTLYHSTVEFTDITTMMHNQADSGGAITAFFSIMNLQGDTTLEHNAATSSGGAIYAYKTNFNVMDKVNITGNIAHEKGGGMHATNTTTTVSARAVLSFRENSAKRGGGVHFEEYSKLHIVKQQAEYVGREDPILWQKVVFTGNNATYGGAIYISDRTIPDTCSSNPFGTSSQECFIQAIALHSFSSHNLNTVNTFFLNNVARISGSTLYGGLLDRCTVNPSAEIFLKTQNITLLDGVSYIQNITNINLSSIASDPVRICFCENGQPDCSYQPQTVYINSEGSGTLSAVAVDQVNTAIPATITSYLTVRRPGEEVSQDVNDSCTDLDFSFLQNSALLLLFADGPCNNLGISQRFVDIVSLSCYCPIGFQPSTSGAGCVCICDSDLYPYITNCSFEPQTVFREGDFWLSFTNNTEPNGYIVHPHCPYDYCLPPTTPVHINLNIPMGPDVQCAHNRSGILCGSCRSGLSSMLGNSQCTHCSNQWLLLLIPFALFGIALLAFLLVCNFTVDFGTINGIILYADIVNTYSASFYSFQKPAVLSVFIAWLSLDFGIESCFYNGMDAYAKTWLQLAFPLYIIILTAILSAISHFSETLRRHLANRLIPIMATVLLLSCTKFFRIMLTALSVTQLDYPDGSHELVWLMDPSITYLKGKHIPLFIAGLLIGLLGTTYSLLLLIGHWVLHWPNIRQNRVMALFDAYYAPFTPKNSYWLGLLLLVRLLLFIVSAANLPGNPRVNLVSIITVLVFLLTLKVTVAGRIYKKWQVDTLETTFIVNLVLFASFTFYATDTNGNQAAIAYISTGVATVTLIGIILCMAIRKIPQLREIFMQIPFLREQAENDCI